MMLLLPPLSFHNPPHTPQNHALKGTIQVLLLPSRALCMPKCVSACSSGVNQKATKHVQIRHPTKIGFAFVLAFVNMGPDHCVFTRLLFLVFALLQLHFLFPSSHLLLYCFLESSHTHTRRNKIGFAFVLAFVNMGLPSVCVHLRYRVFAFHASYLFSLFLHLICYVHVLFNFTS